VTRKASRQAAKGREQLRYVFADVKNALEISMPATQEKEASL
jgi:hypothetical protein